MEVYYNPYVKVIDQINYELVSEFFLFHFIVIVLIMLLLTRLSFI